MKFQIPNPSFNPSFKLKHTDRLFFIGSCFADTMSRYFTERKFTVLQNPFGVLYNPVSIANSLEHIACINKYNEEEFYYQEGLFASWHHHSNLSMPDSIGLKNKLESLNQQSHLYLQQTDVAFITLGTAWAYWHKELNNVVANNLKAPSYLFEQKLLTISEITEALNQTLARLRAINRNIKIVFTLSPVRHSKQGLTDNNLSKARLLEGIYLMCQQDSSLTYLPSYEIIIDVLRDYRFYKNDLVHPNELATDYIWDFLIEKLITEDDHPVLDKLYKLHLAMQHKLRHPKSEQATKFRQEQLQLIEKFQKEYSYLDFNQEREYFLNL